MEGLLGGKNLYSGVSLSLHRFILQDLDDLHLFVATDVARQLQEKLDELMEKNSYNPMESEQQQGQKSKTRD